MPLKDAFKISRKTFFDPTGWLGYDMIATQFKLSKNILKDVLTPAVATRKESFTAAMQRLKLTEEDIQHTAIRYLQLAWVFFTLGILTLAFSFYLILSAGSLSGWILGLASATLFFVYAFRYHFWYFQIKHRTLGCTFAEWRSGKPNSHDDGAPS
jgi:intracellular multiplication protein IcmV